MEHEFHTIIIGGGVAGMTAALYLKRALKDVVILERDAPGGQVTRTNQVENYPGIKSIDGPTLAFDMYEQVTSLGVPFIFEEAISVERIEDKYLVKTKNKELIAKNIVLTLGRRPKKLQVENEEKLSGRGISWCAVCDGPLYKDKEVAVIGGGRAALEETLYLSKICSKVTLIHRRDEFRAENSLVDQLKDAKNIEIITPNTVKMFKEKDGKLSSILLEDGMEVDVSGCFEFIGEEPTTEVVKDLGILDEFGYIQVDGNLSTKLPNIYAGGDCIKKDLYQIVTACADGASIADKIIKCDK